MGAGVFPFGSDFGGVLAEQGVAWIGEHNEGVAADAGAASA